MRNFKMFTIISAVLIIISSALYSLALDQAQEDEYTKARILLNESKIEEARSIFTKLSKDDPSNFKIRLGNIDTVIEEARILKASNSSAWKSKIYAAFRDLKGIFRANATSPEIYLSFAKCYWVNNRFGKAEKSIRKALYYKPDYPEAFILKGDMYFEKSKEIKINPFDDGKSESENYQVRRTAKSSYEKALSGNDIDHYTQAMVNYKLGNMFSYHGNKVKGIEQLNKAVEISPNSYWGEKSKKRINELK